MASLEDVGKSPGGDAIVNFLRITHNDDGTLSGNVGSTPVAFSQAGVLATGTGTLRWLCPYTTAVINGTVASVGTAPTSSSIICDVNKNGTTIYTTQANRPSIAAAAHATSTQPTPDVTSLVFGDYLTVDIDQIGSTVAGSDLVVIVNITRTS